MALPRQRQDTVPRQLFSLFRTVHTLSARAASSRLDHDAHTRETRPSARTAGAASRAVITFGAYPSQPVYCTVCCTVQLHHAMPHAIAPRNCTMRFPHATAPCDSPVQLHHVMHECMSRTSESMRSVSQPVTTPAQQRHSRQWPPPLSKHSAQIGWPDWLKARDERALGTS